MPMGTKRDEKKEVAHDLGQSSANAHPSPHKDANAHLHHLVRVMIRKVSLIGNRSTESSSPHRARTI